MRPYKAEHSPGKSNHNLTLDEFRPYLLFLMICIMIISVAKSDRERAREPVRFATRPVFSTEFEDRKPYAIDQLIEAGEYLYVLPVNNKGFIQVYDLMGNYQHSLFFLEESKGAFTMAAEGDTFYVENKSGDVFVFRDGEFQEYVQRKHAKDRFAHIEFVWQESTPGYVLRGTDLWRVSADREELVIADFVRFDASFAVEILTAFGSIVVLWLLAGWIKRKRMNK